MNFNSPSTQTEDQRQFSRNIGGRWDFGSYEADQNIQAELFVVDGKTPKVPHVMFIDYVRMVRRPGGACLR